MTIGLSSIQQNTAPITTIPINPKYAPSTWIHLMLAKVKGQQGSKLERHLVGAVLERRHKYISILNHPAHAGDRQTARAGDFTVASAVYHVTATPSRNVIQKCAENIKAGMSPILLVPSEQEYRAKALAQDEGIDKNLTITSIEIFMALNIMELTMEENKDFFAILQDIFHIYTR